MRCGDAGLNPTFEFEVGSIISVGFNILRKDISKNYPPQDPAAIVQHQPLS